MFHEVKRFQFNDFTIGQLVANGVHLGHRSIATDPRIFEMLAGDREGISILALGKSISGLKPGLSVLAKIGAKRGKALFPNVDPRIFGVIPTYVKKFCLRYFLVGHKVPGLLTNFMVVRRRFPDLQKTKIVPSFTFGFTVNDHHILWESNRLNIPSIGIFDSNTNPMGHAFYAVPGNDDSFNALHLYYQLAFWALGDGLNRYLFKWGATRKFKLKKILNQFHSLVLLRTNSISNRILENYTNLNNPFRSNLTELNKKRSTNILNTLTRIFYVNIFAYLVNQTYYAYNLGKNAYSGYPYLNINPEFYSFKEFNLPFNVPTRLYLRHKQFFTFLPTYNHNIFDQMPLDRYNTRFKLLGFAKARSILLDIIKNRLRALVLKNKINKTRKSEENVFFSKNFVNNIPSEVSVVSDLINVQKYNYKKLLKKGSKPGNKKFTFVSYYSKNKNLYKLPVLKKSFSFPVMAYGRSKVKQNKIGPKNLITQVNGFIRRHTHSNLSSPMLSQTTFAGKLAQVVFQRREFYTSNKSPEFNYSKIENKNKWRKDNLAIPTKPIVNQSIFPIRAQQNSRNFNKTEKNTFSESNSHFDSSKKIFGDTNQINSNFKFYSAHARKQKYYPQSHQPASIHLNRANDNVLNNKFYKSIEHNPTDIAYTNNRQRPFFKKIDNHYYDNRSKSFESNQQRNTTRPWIKNKIQTYDKQPPVINQKPYHNFFKVTDGSQQQKTTFNPRFSDNTQYNQRRPWFGNQNRIDPERNKFNFENQGNSYPRWQKKTNQPYSQPKPWQQRDAINYSNKQFEHNRKPLPYYNDKRSSPPGKVDFVKNDQFNNKFNQKKFYYKKDFKSNSNSDTQHYYTNKKPPYQKRDHFFGKQFKSNYVFNRRNHKHNKFNQIIKFTPPSEKHLTKFQRTQKHLQALNSLSIKLRRLKFKRMKRLLPVRPREGANQFVIKYVDLLKKIYKKFGRIPYSFRFKRVKLKVRGRKIRRRTPKTIVKIVLKQQARKFFRKFKKRYPTLKFSFIWLWMQKLFKKRVVKRFLRKKVFRYNLTHNPVFGHYKTSNLRRFIRRMPKFRSSIIRKNLYKLPVNYKNYFYWLNSYLNFYVRDLYSVLSKVKSGIRTFKESEIFSRHFSPRNKKFFSAQLQLPFQNQRRLLSYFNFKVRDINELVPKRKKKANKIKVMNRLYRVFRACRLKQLQNFQAKHSVTQPSAIAKFASQSMFNTVGYQTFDYPTLLRAIRNRRLAKREFFRLRRKEYRERVDRKYFNAKGLFQDWQKQKWKKSFAKWKTKQRKFLVNNRSLIVSAALKMGMKVPKVILDSKSIIFKKKLTRKILKAATSPVLKNVIVAKNMKSIRIPKLKFRRHYY